MKRVFLTGYKTRADCVNPIAAPVWTTFWEWVAQEDVTLIGAQLAILVDNINESDGYAMIQAKLMVNGVLDVLHAGTISQWKTVVAASEIATWTNGLADVMFPYGCGLTLKEGESVQVLHEKVGEKAAGTDQFLLSVVLYYVKGL